jgi:hypothetical protein
VRTHEAEGDRKAAKADLTILAALEREIGNEDAAAAWESENGVLRA